MPSPNQPPWRPFTHAGKTYDLTHLSPRTIVFEVPPKGGKPQLRYVVDVSFGTHCFTRGLPDDTIYDRSLEYRDGREILIFDFQRLDLSRQLPAVVERSNSSPLP
jgi:hypothetical protein